MGVVLILLAASANALAAVLQRQVSIDAGSAPVGAMKLIWRLIGTPRWWLGIGALTLGFLLQAAALSQASLTLVQPLLIFELPLTILFAALILGGRLPPRDWAAIAAVALGLAALLASASPHGGHAGAVPGWRWALGGCAALGLMVLLLLGASRAGGRWRAALMGAAAGAGFGICAALIKVCVARIHHDPLALAASWQPYGIVVCGATSLLLFNGAVHTGTLVTVQPAVTLGDPLVSVGLGIALFGEHVRLGALLAPEALGVAMIVLGTLALARSSHLPAGADPPLAAEPPAVALPDAGLGSAERAG